MTTRFAWAVAITVLCTAVNAMALVDSEYIIEANGLHKTNYAEVGGWAYTSAHSLAAGLTPGIGGRYSGVSASTISSAVGTFTFTPQATGPYEVYVTWGRTTNGYSKVDHVLEFDDPANPGAKISNTWVFDISQGGGLHDKWNQLTIDTTTQFNMIAGQPYTLQVKQTQTGGTGSRLMCDAVKFLFKGHGCTDVPVVGGFQGALIAGDTTVTVTGVDPAATKVSVYANGTKIGQNTAPGGATTVTVPVTALINGQTIVATQNKVVGDPPLDTESCLPATGPVVGDCTQIPAVTIGSVVLAGDTSVTVTGVSPLATSVTVYSDGTAIGTNNAPGGNASVNVSVTALVAGAKITATQKFRTLSGCAPADGPVVGACEQIPAVTVAGLVDAGRTQVRVTEVSANATAVKVYANDGTTDTLIGTNNAPGGNSTVLVNVTALTLAQTIKATQVIRIEGCMPTTGQRVMAPWVIEDFEDGVVVLTPANPFPSGANRTWYNVVDAGYGVTTAASGTVMGSKAMTITDNGYQNGVYAIYDQVIPASGTYHLQVSMLADETAAGASLAWMSTYQVGVVVNGQHRIHPAALTGVTAETGAIGDYSPLTEGQDGVGIDGAMRLVYTVAFTANAGDSLLIVFSTNVANYNSAGSSGTGLPAMWVDDITLGQGEPPCVCQRVGAVTVNTGPIEAGQTSVTVSGISTSPLASKVTVYSWDGGDSWTKLGEVEPAAATANVPVTPLVKGKTIVATQTLSACNPAQDMEGCKGKVGPVVGLGKNTGLLMSVGIRETGATAGPVGADGGTTGSSIEWLGPTTAVGGAPQGKKVPSDPAWQTVTFTPGVDKVLSFNAGNGTLDGAWGVLEHLAFALDTTTPNSGRYTIYIDNIYSGTTLLTDFESYAAADKVIFALPNYSGTTSANLLLPPNLAEVSEEEHDGATGTKSLKISFQFVDVQQKRWLRLTSYKSTTSQLLTNPLIELTQPITMRVLLKGTKDCGAVFADRDKDGDVDQADFGEFQKCYTGLESGIASGCECFDRDGDEKIDATDLNAFTDCWSGPAIAADPACDEE